jgi:hypothetical protein
VKWMRIRIHTCVNVKYDAYGKIYVYRSEVGGEQTRNGA